MSTPTPAPQPQKKSWFARHKILTSIGVLVLLGAIFGGGSGSGGNSTKNVSERVTGTSDATPSTDEAAAQPADDATTQAPVKAKAKPAGNVIGNWTILTKHPKFGQEYGTFKDVKIDVKNTSDSEDQPWLEIRLTKGNRLVTTFDCMGDTVRPGEITTLDCSSLDDYGTWTKYEIKNAF